MDSVGIRELRQRMRELLRRVEAGETIEISDRGRPVAQLAPLSFGGARARLRASGDLIPATHSMADLPEPLPIAAGLESASVVLERLRGGER